MCGGGCADLIAEGDRGMILPLFLGAVRDLDPGSPAPEALQPLDTADQATRVGDLPPGYENVQVMSSQAWHLACFARAIGIPPCAA